MAFQIPDWTPALPEIFMLGMTCVVILAYVFMDQKNKGITYVLTQVTLISSAILSIISYHRAPTITFNGSFILDQSAAILHVFIYMTTFFVLLYSRHYIREKQMLHGEYYILSLFSVLGMTVLVSAYSMITLFMGLELMSLPLYAMIAMRKHENICHEAAMKYFMMGAIASGMLLYGMSMVYGVTNALDLNNIYHYVSTQSSSNNNVLLMVGLVFMLVGVLFKLGAAPFHMWVPDIYEGAPASVTLLVATGPKLAAFALILRVLVDGLPTLQPEWQHMLIAVAVLSMAIGNIVAIVQSNLRRMLAYSSIANIGYMSLGFIAGTPTGYGAAMFYMIIYVIMSAGAFGIITLLSRKGFEVEKIDDFKGLNSRNPWLAFLMLLIMFSMAGVPPSAGFFAKMSVLESLVRQGNVWLPALALLFAIIGAFYYLRVVKVMYFDEAENKAPLHVESFDAQLAISINGLAVLFLGLFPTALVELCYRSF